MTHVDLASVAAPRRDPLTATVDDELVMLDLRHGVYLDFDDIARRVWELLDGRRSIGSVCDVLLTEYDVELERCRADVIDLVRQLLDADLVTVQ